MSFARSLVLLLACAVLSNALASPHAVRHAAHHHAIAARVAAPLDVPLAPLRKRQDGKRCRQRFSTSSAPAATSTRTSTSAAVVNVAPTPKLITTTSKAAEPTPPTPTLKPTTHAEPTTTRAPTTTHTTSKAPAPAPAPTTTKKASSSSGGSNLPSFMVGTQSGQGTFYATGLGACGITNKDTDHIAAVSHLLFDNFPGYNGGNPNNNPLCGMTVTATYQGKRVTVAVTDRCEACSLTDLDFSPSAFNELADFAVGRISGMTWVWND